MKIRKRELGKSLILTGIAILVLFIILFPVYYIFTVSIKPSAALATTKIELIPKNITLEGYKEVLFGLGGEKIDANFTGTVSGDFTLVNGMLYVKSGIIKGKVKYGPFTGFTFEIPIKGKYFTLSEIPKEELKVRGEIIITKIEGDKIGFAIIKDVSSEKGKLKGYIVARNSGTVKFSVIGKFVNSAFFKYLKNSLILAGLTVVLTLIFVIPAAYAFSRMKFFGREHVLYFYLMFTQVAGGLGIAGLIALYGMLVKLGLYNKLPALALVYAAGGVPFNTWLLKSYIDSISPDFDEAALVDGASYLQIIRYVLLPMALPGIATVAIFAFIGGWTEFILASLLLTEENQPLSVWIYTLMGSIGRGIDWNYFAAAALLFALPVFIMFMLAQNYIRSGLTIGGLKE
ncbi:ABC transporter permease subunit [Pyrococcus sp. ST04]|uniref:ABC transporter permease subunit n=1 Tax=Pyrococcus sp. ST04 TaxID=1183377 RepID=UPI0002605983|nr:ABC transporter permease subunit [Pyrococcus sp. ST04]AFK21812.1 malg-like sugar transport inner membrane protein [Pyrococcus sp. ST04]